MGEARVQLRDLSKYYYSEMAVTRALRKIDLSFEMNEFVAITGESGSGKSTLLRIISGMEEFDEGELLIDGQLTSQYDDDDWEHYRREKIGYIFQDYSLITHYSVRNNVVSALMIMGMSHSQAVKKADQSLEQVGLKGMEKKPASTLSSGQKQRLSIARALAKGTDIILADEPTGNLDSETGDQIVRLLKELSKDHLIIMVTHNYEQVEAYATRKIRLHDGEVVQNVKNEERVTGVSEEDLRVNRTDRNVEYSESLDKDQSTNRDIKQYGNLNKDLSVNRDISLSKKGNIPRFYIHRVASLFASWNVITQKGITALFFIFFAVMTTISFYFIGEILMNADERMAMEYDNSAFPEEDKTRIVAKRQDGKPIIEQDLDVIRPMSHVVLVDQYDNVNDINYYYREDQDYQYQYGYMYQDEYVEVDENELEYMENVENIEIKESVEFLDDSHFMRSSTCISEKDLAAGNLPEKRGEVILYSQEGEKAIGSTFTCYLRHIPIWGYGEYVNWTFKVVGVLREETEQVYFSPAMCQMLTAILDNDEKYTMNFFYVREAGRFLGKDDFLPLIGDGLKGDELQVSLHYQVPYQVSVGGKNVLPKDPRAAFGTSGFLWYKDYLEIFRHNSQGEWQEPIKLNGQNVKTENLHLSSEAFLAMSEEWFTQYNDMNSYQASVYISSYAKTTEVLRALQDAGYDAISTYQASVKEYDSEKANKRLAHLAIALAALLVILIAEVLILGSLMKLRRKDYSIWRFMGMDRKLTHRIADYEMGFYLLMAMIFAIAVAYYADTRFAYIHEMLYYYELPGWLSYIAYNLVALLLTVTVFYHHLDFNKTNVNRPNK